MSNADLAARLSALVDQWNAYKNELGAILTQATGDVTMTDGTGKLVTLPSFPQLQSNVDALTDELTGASASAQGSRTAANLSASYAAQSAQDADGSATAADASASSVATQATQATTSANAAAASETSASTSAATATSAATSASSSATSATTDAADASSYADDSASSASLAEQWADASENTQVTPGNYSAYHWAMNAQSTVTGLLTYRGSWSAASGAYPATPRKGDFWKVSSVGTVGGVQYATGDQIINNGSGWDKIDNTEQVTMVAGRVGEINLTAGDIAGLGTAATADSSTFATAAQGAKADSAVLSGSGYWAGSDANTAIADGFYRFASPSTNTPHNDWANLITNGFGTHVVQTAWSWNYDDFAWRSKSGSSWSDWKFFWDSSNFDPDDKANLSGATFTGAVSAANLSGTNTGDQNLSGYMPKSGGVFTGAVSAANLSGTNTGDQNLSGYAPLSNPTFSVSATIDAGGAEAQLRFGVDDWYYFSNANNMGWYSNAAGYGLKLVKATKQVSVFGGLDVAGTVTATSVTDTSDARLKTNLRRDKNRWRGIRRKIELVLYDRIDGSSNDEPGVIAQEVQKIAPEFVGETADGTLTVHYGKLALACALDPDGL